jgi:hypothetical protein
VLVKHFQKTSRIVGEDEANRQRKSAGSAGGYLAPELLADKTDLHWTFISGVECGMQTISIVNLHRIPISLGVQLRYVLDKCSHRSILSDG